MTKDQCFCLHRAASNASDRPVRKFAYTGVANQDPMQTAVRHTEAATTQKKQQIFFLSLNFVVLSVLCTRCRAPHFMHINWAAISMEFFSVEICDFSLRAIDICFNAALQSLVWCCLSIFTFEMNRIKRIAANAVWPLIYPLCLRYITSYCEW